MCNCGNDEVKKLNDLATPRSNNDDSTQEQQPQSSNRKSKVCCKAKRTLTYDDEVTITEIPSPPPLPPPIQRKSPGLRRCELAGVAIVRRRIDFGPSPEHTDYESQQPAEQEASNSVETEVKKNEEDKPEGEKDKEKEEEVNDKDKEKANDSEKVENLTNVTEQKRQSQDKNEQAKKNSITTSTPCPEKLSPQNECNCSIVPKT